jgi:phage terminase large subunit GpA-like protein
MGIPYGLDDYGVDPGFLQSLLKGRLELERVNAIAARSLIRPDPTPILEWAQETVRVPAGTGYSSGAFKALPFQKGIIEAWQEDGVDRIYFEKVPRLGSSFICAIGMLYASCFEGEDSIYFERSKADLQRFYDDNIDAIMAESPELQALRFPSHEERWQDQRLRNGATLRFRSAAKDSAFKAIKGKRIFTDEVDADVWGAGSKSAGDKLDRAAKRGQQFGDSILYAGSSPESLATSRIHKGFIASDQRTYRVHCPKCATSQELYPIMQPGDGPGMRFRMDGETNRVATYTSPNGFVAPDIWYECVSCNGAIRETAKSEMLEHGFWKGKFTKAEAERPGYVGYHMWSAYSTDPKSSWHHVVDEFRASLSDPSKRKTFQNEWLGLPWDEENVRPVEVHWLRSRRVWAYPAPVPPCVNILTAGADEQTGKVDKDAAVKSGKIARTELSIWGWGEKERSALIGHFIIPHRPFSHDSNVEKLRILNDVYPMSNGDWRNVAGCANDVGDGNTINEAIAFLSSPEARAVGLIGVKGANEAKGTYKETISAGKPKDGRLQYEFIRTQSAKTLLMSRLNLDGFGPGSVVFPPNPQVNDAYFKSLTSIVLKEQDEKRWWEDRPGNEANDCFVYAYARMLLLKRNLPNLADDFEAEYLDSLGIWAMEHRNKADRSWQSDLLEAERRVTGGYTAGQLEIRRRPSKKQPVGTVVPEHKASMPQAAPASPFGFGPGGARPGQVQQHGAKYGPVGQHRKPGW